MVGHKALGVGAAVAGVHTVAVEAGLGLTTVVIGGAAHYHHGCNTHQLEHCNIISPLKWDSKIFSLKKMS